METSGPGKTDFAKLIEVMESNNKSTAQIEIDGRNTRRHLLEMKKMQKVMVDFQERTLFGFQNFQDMIDNQSLQGLENSLEQKSIFEDIRSSLKQIEINTALGKGGGGRGGGNFFGKAALLGAGAALVGAGTGFAALGFAIPAFFGALQAGEFGLEALNADFKFDNIKRAAIGFSDIITSIPPEGLTALAGLLGVSAIGGLKGNSVGTAIGFSLLGAAIPGFFGGFAVGDALLGVGFASGLDPDYKAIKMAVRGFSGVMEEFPNDITGAKMAAVLGIGTALGMSAGKGNDSVFDIALGMTALGAGIVGFFAGFAIGDLALSGIANLSGQEPDYRLIKESVAAFSDTIGLLSTEAEVKLLALIGTGGLIAKLAGFGGSAKLFAGMSLIGASISGFFVGFGSIATLGGALGVNGRNTKALLTNFGEGIQALDKRTFDGIATMMGVSGIAALFPGSAVVAAKGGGILAIIGASLAGFITAFDGVTTVGAALGVNGSSTKVLLTNIAEGINALAILDIDGAEIAALGGGLGALATGIVAFLTLEGIGGIGSRLARGVTNAMDLVSSGFGLFARDDQGKSIFEKIAEDVQPLLGLNRNKGMEEFNDLAENIVSLAFLDMNEFDSAGKAFERFGDSVVDTAERINFALNGGTIGQLSFVGMTNDIENATVGLERLRNSLNMNSDGLSMVATRPMEGLAVGNMSVENAILKMQQPIGGANINTVTKGGDNIRGGDQILIQTKPGTTTDSLLVER